MNRFSPFSDVRPMGVESELEVSIQFFNTGEFFFSGMRPDGHQVGGLALSFLLFARFPDNVYGTTSRFDFYQGEPGVFLSPREALKYFQGNYFNSIADIIWPLQVSLLRETAGLLQNVLEMGRFAPDWSVWQTGKMGWKILDDELKGSDDVVSNPEFARAWLNSIIKQLIEEETTVRSAFAGVVNGVPLLELRTSDGKTKDRAQRKKNGRPREDAVGSVEGSSRMLTEPDWLAEIGWMEHPVPFQVCLELTEPSMLSFGEEKARVDGGLSGMGEPGDTGFDNQWGLCIVLQDKQDASRLFYYRTQHDGDREIAGRASVMGDSLIGEMPPTEWLEHQDWLDNKIQEMTELVPWLHKPTDGAWLTTDEAWRFLAEASFALTEAGYTLFLPAWWEKVQRTKPRVKIRVESSVGSETQPLFGIDQTIDFDWHIAVGNIELSESEYRKLVAAKSRLVRLRGQWIEVSPEFLAATKRALQRLERKHGLTFRDVLEMYLLGLPKGAQVRQPLPSPESANTHVQQVGNGETTDEAESDGVKANDDAEPITVPIDIELNKHLAEFIARLQQTDTELLPTPVGFAGELRPYQVRGFSWLSFLYQFGLGAVLADDMGLGKTVQYIAYLLQTRVTEGDARAEAAASLDSGAAPDGATTLGRAAKLDGGTQKAYGPALLICPTSVLGNWQKELVRFAPGIRTYVHYGTERQHGEAFHAAVAQADLVLTTYALAQIDEPDLASVTWDSVCLDEAQNIKNAHGKQSIAIRKLSAQHRIAMTGTPMENRLTELWSIFDFINPGYLGGLTAFTRRFVTPIEKTRDTALLAQLQQLVRPFLLRRLKTDPAIELDLPEKTENKVYVSLTAEQAALYESILADLLIRIDAADPMERRGLILSTLTRLKQVCNHPALALKDGAGQPARAASQRGRSASQSVDGTGPALYIARSAKLERFVEMVQELRAEGDKCIVFTQFVETGNMLIDMLQAQLGEEVLFLHGGSSKKQRDEMIAAFGRDDGTYGVFLLSLKAGGVGLNLTAANHVFHFDRWWNPAVENQATDRAYRIGQHQHVNVYKFVALGTVEERIDELISRKQAQSEEVLGAGEQWITELSTDELRDLFALRREWVE